LIAVAVVALLLLGVGGIGVLQERSTLQDEVTELRSQLATSASPEEVTAARESVRSLEESNQALEDEIARLELENRRLTDMVSGLESQLKNQSAAVEELERSAEQAREAAARRSTTSGSAASAGTGTWFVNFGSYGNREAAETWATRLRKDYGKVIVAPAASQGRSLYRVRVIGLPSKAEAERVARELEQAHDLSKLWVGSE
jgi:cell division septation protein DedD